MQLEDLASMLSCPHCGGGLVVDAEHPRCASCGRCFSIVGGQPILVAFDDSILSEDDLHASGAGSSIRRRADRKPYRIRDFLLSSNQVAARNAQRFIELARALSAHPKILIVGGGSKGEGTESLYEDDALRLISFDIYASELTQFVADAHRIPLADMTVDAVWIQAVLEHVLDPWRVVQEIHRVLRPHGIVYAETPFLQQVHEGAYDFTRFTESGHRWLFRRFEEIESGVVLGAASQLLWSIEHVVRGSFRSIKAGVAVKVLLFWIRYLDRIIPCGYASDAASAVYFLGRKSNVTLSPKDMIGFYRGAHARRS
jgi:SAM-dependent methyltransferase